VSTPAQFLERHKALKKKKDIDTDVIKINITMSFPGRTSVMSSHALQIGPTGLDERPTHSPESALAKKMKK